MDRRVSPVETVNAGDYTSLVGSGGQSWAPGREARPGSAGKRCGSDEGTGISESLLWSRDPC
jgi:hypothetical protein